MQAHKRERAVLGELAGMPAQELLRKRKKVQKAQNRRVSFAPDNQLHLFSKVHTRYFLQQLPVACNVCGTCKARQAAHSPACSALLQCACGKRM